MHETPKAIWEIGSGTMIRALLFLFLAWLLYYLRDLLLVIITAVVIASAIEPFITALRKRRVGRVAAVTIIYLIVAVACVALVYFFIPPLIDDTIGILDSFGEQFQTLHLFEVQTTQDFLQNANDLRGKISPQDALEQVRNVISGATGGLFRFTSAVFGGALSFLLIVILSFYFAVQETGIDDFLRVITPIRKQEYVIGLWKRSQAKIGLWMQGQILLGLIVAVLVYLGLTIIGVPHAFFLAILSGVFELIPIFGPIIAGLPAVMLGFSGGGVTMGLMTIGLYLIIQQFENNLIYPLVVRKVVGVHPIMVIIALLAGAKIAGFLGIILSVPIAAALKEYIDDVQKSKERQRKHLDSAE